MQDTLRADGEAIRRFRVKQSISQFSMQESSLEAGWPKVSFTERNLRDAEKGKRIRRDKLESIALMLRVGLGEIVVSDERACPFPGLRSFDTNEHQFFGGRDSEIEEAINRLKHCDVVAIVGASGSGKSSLVHAGILPRLEDETSKKTERVVISLRPGLDPVRSLSIAIAALNQTGLNKLNEADGIEKRLKTNPLELKELILDVAKTTGRHDQLLIFVDQWEELYDQRVQSDLRNTFLSVLNGLIRDKAGRILLTLRADFIGDLLNEQFGQEFTQEFVKGQIPLKRMSSTELRKAIEKPASLAKLKFESGLVSTMLGDAQNEPSQLPVIQSALTQMWYLRDQSTNTLTLDSYANDVGRLVGAINTHADTVFNSLNDTEKHLSRTVLTRLVATAPNRRDVSRRLPIGEFDKNEIDLIQKLAAEKTWLVSIDNDGSGDEVELGHEALARNWTLLRTWLSENPRYFAWRDEMRSQLSTWVKNGKSSSDILRGSALAEARNWTLVRRDFLNESELTFIQTSIDTVSLEKQKEASLRRRIQLASVILLVAAVGALVLFTTLNLDLTRKTDEVKANRNASRIAQARLLAITSERQRLAGQTNSALATSAAGLPSVLSPDQPVTPEVLQAAKMALTEFRPSLEVSFAGNNGDEVADFAILEGAKTAVVLTMSNLAKPWRAWLVDLSSGSKQEITPANQNSDSNFRPSDGKLWHIDSSHSVLYYVGSAGKLFALDLLKDSGPAKHISSVQLSKDDTWQIDIANSSVFQSSENVFRKIDLTSEQVTTCEIPQFVPKKSMFMVTDDGFVGAAFVHIGRSRSPANLRLIVFRATNNGCSIYFPRFFQDPTAVDIDDIVYLSPNNTAVVAVGKDEFKFEIVDLKQKPTARTIGDVDGTGLASLIPLRNGRFIAVAENGKVYALNENFDTASVLVSQETSNLSGVVSDPSFRFLVISFEDSNGMSSSYNSISVDLEAPTVPEIVLNTGEKLFFSRDGSYFLTNVDAQENLTAVYSSSSFTPVAAIKGAKSIIEDGSDPILQTLFDGAAGLFLVPSSSDRSRLLVWRLETTKLSTISIPYSPSISGVGPATLYWFKDYSADFMPAAGIGFTDLVIDWTTKRTWIDPHGGLSLSDYIVDSRLSYQVGLDRNGALWKLQLDLSPQRFEGIYWGGANGVRTIEVRGSKESPLLVLKDDRRIFVVSGRTGKILTSYLCPENLKIRHYDVALSGDVLVENAETIGGQGQYTDDLVNLSLETVSLGHLKNSASEVTTRPVKHSESIVFATGSANAVIIDRESNSLTLWDGSEETKVVDRNVREVSQAWMAGQKLTLAFMPEENGDITVNMPENEIVVKDYAVSETTRYLALHSKSGHLTVYDSLVPDKPILNLSEVEGSAFTTSDTFLIVSQANNNYSVYNLPEVRLLGKIAGADLDFTTGKSPVEVTESGSHAIVRGIWPETKLIPILPANEAEQIELIKSNLPKFEVEIPLVGECSSGSTLPSCTSD